MEHTRVKIYMRCFGFGSYSVWQKVLFDDCTGTKSNGRTSLIANGSEDWKRLQSAPDLLIT